MLNKETKITKLEKGRAEFAYRCTQEGESIQKKVKIDEEWYEDEKYGSYVKKIPQMILSNGLGQTLAYILSKCQRYKGKKEPGGQDNPKNACDLIYKHLTSYLKSDTVARISMPTDKKDLLEWVISCSSTDYRYITQELLAFLNWLKRFAEGMISEREEQ